VVQEGAWSKDLQAEPFGGTKVAKVMRDDEVGLARDGDLDDHVVVRILQKRPPKEEDLLAHGNLADPIDESLDMLRALPASKVAEQR
jgi:hypothetical protein